MRIFRIGEAVQARWGGRGGQYYPGTVTTVHADHRYDVSYDDGDRETRVEARYLRPLSADVETALNQERTFEVDERVLARWESGAAFFPARIVGVRAGDAYDVAYDDGDAEADVPSQRIVSLAVGVAPEPGDGVLARWKADWHAGTVRYASNATHYDIYFADGSGKTVDADGLRVVVRGHVHTAATLSAAAPGANGEL